MDKLNGSIIKEFTLDKMVNLDILTDDGMKLLEQGYIVDINSGKLTPAIRSKPVNVPWFYVRPDDSKDCGFWHNIIFDIYEMFPVGCLDCWKVVVRPRTLTELFKLLVYQKDVYDSYCKCGIELRKYVHGNYGGYFYNNSLEEGLQCYERVRTGINQYISPDVPVILKRACTEYEMKFGDSSKWEDIVENGIYEKDGVRLTTRSGENLLDRTQRVKNNVDIIEKSKEVTEGCSSIQPQMVQISVMRSWMEHAYAIGDPTAFDHNDGKPFYGPPTTYHNNKNHDFKKYKGIKIKGE